MNLQNKIDYSIALLRKCEQMALDYDQDNGFCLAFSGGKDSQVLYHLAKMAGVKFKAHMNLTRLTHPMFSLRKTELSRCGVDKTKNEHLRYGFKKTSNTNKDNTLVLC